VKDKRAIVVNDVHDLAVRDSVARLPNGEGTRGDICELLKDSQFLAPGITDAQVQFDTHLDWIS